MCRDPEQFAALAAGVACAARPLPGRHPVPEPLLAVLVVAVVRRPRAAAGDPGAARRPARRGRAADADAPSAAGAGSLGGSISDFSDVLLDDSCAALAAGALAEGLRCAARGALVDLREVRPGAAAEQLYAAWDGPRRSLVDSVCLELPGVSMDALLRRLPGARARGVRARLRRLDALGVEERSVPAHEVPGRGGDLAAAARALVAGARGDARASAAAVRRAPGARHPRDGRQRRGGAHRVPDGRPGDGRGHHAAVRGPGGRLPLRGGPRTARQEGGHHRHADAPRRTPRRRHRPHHPQPAARRGAVQAALAPGAGDQSAAAAVPPRAASGARPVRGAGDRPCAGGRASSAAG